MPTTQSTTSMVMMLLLLTILQLTSTLDQSDNYIIHMDPTFMPKSNSSIHNWYLATVSSLMFSSKLSSEELTNLKVVPGYVTHMRDSPVKVDTTHSPWFLGLNLYLVAWPAASYGKNVIIGLVDTGIWPKSRSFRDDGFKEVPLTWRGKCETGAQFDPSMRNKKLIGARFFNKGLFAWNPHLNFSVNSTRDTKGHGTYTSSTAGGRPVEGATYFGYASGTAVGVAPMAGVAMYKDLWHEGTELSDIIVAIDQAIKDGVHVLSLSLGLVDLQL